ncbi:hypothetical protein B0H13DRAFT_1894747 [Mycena leptocephala]|nr:hypothetical protein B0H13DRAFT_1894747 [Mycena leptocephala]
MSTLRMGPTTWRSQLARVVRRLGWARGVTVVRRGASNVVMACRLHLRSDGGWWSREMSWAKLEGGGDGAGGGREEKQREAAARGRRSRPLSRTQNDTEYAEKRAEDDQRKWRTGDRTGAGGARGRRVRGRGRASGEKSGLCGGAAKDGSDLTGTQARWLSGNKHIGDKGGREICTRNEMGWNAHIETWNDELDTTGLWSKPETNGRYTSPSCPHGRGTELGASAQS